MDKIQLDSLILENCAKQINPIERICLELVGRDFAGVLRSVSCKQKTSLFIGHDSNAPLSSECRLSVSFVAKRNLIISTAEQANKILTCLFSRIRRLLNFKLNVASHGVGLAVLRAILSAILREECRLMALSRLTLSADSQSVECAADLIRQVAPLLKFLNLDLAWCDEDQTTKLWTSIALCENLRTLLMSLHFDYDDEENTLRRNARLSQCLKRLKMRRFEINKVNFRHGEAFIQWIADSFSDNKNLRKLRLFNSFHNDLANYCDPAVLQIIAQLYTLVIKISNLKQPENEKLAIVQILNTLPQSGYLTVNQEIDNSFIEEILGRDITVTEMVAIVLNFWLELSGLTERLVRLYLHSPPDENLTREIASYLAAHPFVTAERTDRCTILQQESARIWIFIDN